MQTEHGVQMTDFEMKVLFHIARVHNNQITCDKWRQLGVILDSHQYLRLKDSDQIKNTEQIDV